uniref:Myozenin 1 n=1 Tax=Tetraodon nigroviridis TaxID=99883 RepID=H3CPT0_TETNG
MPVGTPAPLNKRKKAPKIITDLAHVTQDASEFDLGKKIKTPKEIMLEELSLMKNRGSKMFKMRQQRVEKFIYENNPDLFTSESMDNLQKFVPSLGGQMGGQMINVGGHSFSKEAGHMNFVGLHRGGGHPVPPHKAWEQKGGGNREKTGKGEGGGAAVPTMDVIVAGGRSDGKTKYPQAKTYVSPWEKAMKGDKELIATLKTSMPGPLSKKDIPKWKSFNRCAMPYGGFEKANQFMKFQLPKPAPKLDPEPAMVYQHDAACRPSFNRTPIGWVGSSEPSSIHMEAVPFDGETDEL